MLLAVAFTPGAQASHAPPGPQGFSTSFNLCVEASPSRCGTGLTGYDNNGAEHEFQIVDPNSGVYDVSLSFTIAGGANNRCGPSTGCGFQVWLCSDAAVDLSADCNTGTTAYFAATYVSNGAATNNDGRFSTSSTWGDATPVTFFTGTGDFQGAHTLQFVLDTNIKTVYYYLDGTLRGTESGSDALVGFGGLFISGTGGAEVGCTPATSCSTRSVSISGSISNVIQTHGPPEQPPGSSGTVTQAYADVSTPCLIDVTWVLAPNDPDQETGDFEYHVVSSAAGVLTDTVDTVSSMDGDGVRYHQLSYGGTVSPGPVTIQIYAVNTTTDETSFYSEAITVDCDELGSFDSAGETTGAVPGASATDTAAGLKGFCAGLMGDSDGSLFLCGLILVATVFLSAAGAFAALASGGDKKRPVGHGPMVAGSVGGFGMMVFNVFAGIWGIVWAIVLIVLVAAVLTFLIKRSMGGGAPGGE